jgi:hypothetical protein
MITTRGTVDINGAGVFGISGHVKSSIIPYAPKTNYNGVTVIDASEHVGQMWRIHSIAINPVSDCEFLWFVENQIAPFSTVYNTLEYWAVPAKGIVCKDFHNNYIELPEGADLTIYSSLGAASDFYYNVYVSIGE